MLLKLLIGRHLFQFQQEKILIQMKFLQKQISLLLVHLLRLLILRFCTLLQWYTRTPLLSGLRCPNRTFPRRNPIRRRNTRQTDCFCELRAITAAALSSGLVRRLIETRSTSRRKRPWQRTSFSSVTESDSRCLTK